MSRSAALPAAGQSLGAARRLAAWRLGRRGPVAVAGKVVIAAIAASAALLGTAAKVEAHAIESSLTRVASLSNGLLVHSQFSSGLPAVAAQVRLIPPGGQPIEVGHTDNQGQLSFALPKGANGDWELQVDGGPGHRDYLNMPVQGGKAQLDRLSDRHGPGLADGLATALHPGVLVLGGLCGLAGVLIGLDRRRRRG
ncbi:MAG: hypothetical protein NTZ53_11125 [Cyanobacteria bacterium]|nr:hypothetical protein [Cyanobacteriota bacterium]